MQDDILTRIENAIAVGRKDDQFFALLQDAHAEIIKDRVEIARLRGVAGAVSDGPSLSELRKTTGC